MQYKEIYVTCSSLGTTWLVCIVLTLPCSKHRVAMAASVMTTIMCEDAAVVIVLKRILILIRVFPPPV